mgnify:CR=1 FL=1
MGVRAAIAAAVETPGGSVSEFCEAAGISRFKAKKLETLRKLERVDADLTRVRDILSELDEGLREEVIEGLPRDQLAKVLQVDMPRHELGEAVYDRDDRLAEIAILHAGRAPQGAGAGHVAAVGGSAGTVDGHLGDLRENSAVLLTRV